MHSTHWALRLIHFLYAVFVTSAFWLLRRERTQPNPLKAYRSKIPKHLCLNLVANDDIRSEETEATFLQCLQDVATWCRELGITTLSVYDRYGVLHGCPGDARRHVFVVTETSEDSCESEVEYPLTPPPSDSSGSRSHSPEHEALPLADLHVITVKSSSRIRKRSNVAVRRQFKSQDASSNLTLHIVSRASGKPAIASTCRSLLQGRFCDTLMSDDETISRLPYNLTASKLGAVVEAGLPPPDFMIIHHISAMEMPYPPIELHGFPPWQITLTEFHRTDPSDNKECELPGLISETAFCRALDEYAGAEFRLGR